MSSISPRDVRSGERSDETDLTEFPSRCPRSISPSIAETMMEAVGMEATDDVSLVVKAVVSPGYSWHGERVLTKTQVEVEPEEV